MIHPSPKPDGAPIIQQMLETMHASLWCARRKFDQDPDMPFKRNPSLRPTRLVSMTRSRNWADPPPSGGTVWAYLEEKPDDKHL